MFKLASWMVCNTLELSANVFHGIGQSIDKVSESIKKTASDKKEKNNEEKIQKKLFGR